jgi:hypothetical protein
MPCEAGVLCDRERVSHHYSQSGIGPLGDAERVVFVVFDKTLKLGDALIQKIFDDRNDKIVNGDFSLARKDYTTSDEAMGRIVSPGLERGETYVGVSVALVSDIRRIVANTKGVGLGAKGRVLCVLDKVADGEIAAHATLMYCIHEGDLKPSKRGALRALVRADLAEKFGPIQAMADVFT